MNINQKRPREAARTATCCGILSLLFLHCVQADEYLPIASPVASVPTNRHLPGKLVWIDLVTTNPGKAAKFYSDVFGWTTDNHDSGDYIELRHNGRPVCSVVAYDRRSDANAKVDARWLVSISAINVDGAASTAIQAGGVLLEPVADFDNRGRFALIKDPQGAVLMLLSSRGGDPADEPLEMGSWGWAELWTDDIDRAVSFYKTVVGYETRETFDELGKKRVVLGSSGKARATVVPMPWPDVEPNWVPYVPVADATEMLKRIEGAGGGVIATLPASGKDLRIALLMDPTGGVFGIQQLEGSK